MTGLYAILGFILLTTFSLSECYLDDLSERGRVLQKFPGICMDCGYFIPNMHCDLSVPCKVGTCRKECIHDVEVGEVNRPQTCNASQNTEPEMYRCWWDTACQNNERCCITTTGSYCSS